MAAKILLVEDNEMNRDMLSRRLQRRGYEVMTAVDGESGLVMTKTEMPALVLMDMSLPGIDGWEATRQIKADPATRAIPVIALTAHAMAGDREKALAVGCDDFDTKPIDLDRLLGKIAALLASCRARLRTCCSSRAIWACASALVRGRAGGSRRLLTPSLSRRAGPRSCRGGGRGRWA